LYAFTLKPNLFDCNCKAFSIILYTLLPHSYQRHTTLVEIVKNVWKSILKVRIKGGMDDVILLLLTCVG